MCALGLSVKDRRKIMTFLQRRIQLSILLIVLASAMPVASKTWHVRQDGTGDTAYLDLAVYWAQTGDTVLVGPGWYLQPMLELGAIHLISEAGPEATTIELYIMDIEWDVHVIVIGDVYTGSEWVPLHVTCMNEAIDQGYQLKSIVVKDMQHNRAKRNVPNLWRYRALAGGYYIFKHEYVLFLKNAR